MARHFVENSVDMDAGSFDFTVRGGGTRVTPTKRKLIGSIHKKTIAVKKKGKPLKVKKKDKGNLEPRKRGRPRKDDPPRKSTVKTPVQKLVVKMKFQVPLKKKADGEEEEDNEDDEVDEENEGDDSKDSLSESERYQESGEKESSEPPAKKLKVKAAIKRKVSSKKAIRKNTEKKSPKKKPDDVDIEDKEKHTEVSKKVEDGDNSMAGPSSPIKSKSPRKLASVPSSPIKSKSPRKAPSVPSSPIKSKSPRKAPSVPSSPIKSQSPRKAPSVPSSPIRSQSPRKAPSVPSSPIKSQSPRKAPSVPSSPIKSQSPRKAPSVPSSPIKSQSPRKAPSVPSSPIKSQSPRKAPSVPSSPIKSQLPRKTPIISSPEPKVEKVARPRGRPRKNSSIGSPLGSPVKSPQKAKTPPKRKSSRASMSEASDTEVTSTEAKAEGNNQGKIDTKCDVSKLVPLVLEELKLVEPKPSLPSSPSFSEPLIFYSPSTCSARLALLDHDYSKNFRQSLASTSLNQDEKPASRTLKQSASWTEKSVNTSRDGFKERKQRKCSPKKVKERTCHSKVKQKNKEPNKVIETGSDSKNVESEMSTVAKTGKGRKKSGKNQKSDAEIPAKRKYTKRKSETQDKVQVSKRKRPAKTLKDSEVEQTEPPVTSGSVAQSQKRFVLLKLNTTGKGQSKNQVETQQVSPEQKPNISGSVVKGSADLKTETVENTKVLTIESSPAGPDGSGLCLEKLTNGTRNAVVEYIGLAEGKVGDYAGSSPILPAGCHGVADSVGSSETKEEPVLDLDVQKANESPTVTSPALKTPGKNRRVSIGGVETREISPEPKAFMFDLASVAFAEPVEPPRQRPRRSLEGRSPKSPKSPKIPKPVKVTPSKATRSPKSSKNPVSPMAMPKKGILQNSR